MFEPTLNLSRAAGQLALDGYAEVAPFQPDLPSGYLERRYANGASRFVDVDGARVHYRDEGPRDGPTLVALHGMYSSLHTWDDWVGALADRVRVVRMDLPGFGLTGPTTAGTYDMPYYVDIVEAFCRRLEMDEVALAGNSMGGGVAWRVAAEHPELVDRLLLLDSVGRQVVPDGAEFLVQPGVSIVPRYLTPRAAFREILRDAYGDPSRLERGDVRRYHDLLRRTGNRRAVLSLLRAASPADVDPAEVTCPTLVQWGERDTWLPLSLGEKLAGEIPDGKLRTYEGVGHIPMEEAPAATAADAVEFLT
jgi:pimeloyl-ACP methyl ester carboxylesterase